jgi:hypothetical protein
MTLLACCIVIAVLGNSAFVPGADPETLVVMDTIVGQRYVHSTARFDMSEESGRAWVEAMVDNGGTGDDYDSFTLRSKVQNLSYDARTKEIVYSGHGSRITCARVTRSKFLFFTRTDIKSTGRCELPARLEHRADDDGFEHQTNEHLVVELRTTP